jgi:FKBP-type peptidyl-prolyl cis-trans isomerase
MDESDSGLRYWIYEQADTLRAQTGGHVKINYTVHLMDGTLCYSSDEEGALSFTIGHANVAPGLHEAVCLMGKTEKAKFVFPSHLGWGVTGDSEKIPSDAVLIYDVELVNVW